MFPILEGHQYVRRDGSVTPPLTEAWAGMLWDSERSYYFRQNGVGRVYSFTEDKSDLMRPIIQKEISEDDLKELL